MFKNAVYWIAFISVCTGLIGALLILKIVRSGGDEIDMANLGAHIEISVGNSRVVADMAATPEAKSLGLSGREYLGSDEGMFFLFESPGLYSFWMKDMKFSIDIIWIDEGFTVADITRNASPESFPKSFYPSRLVQYVLEVPAGWAFRHGIGIGDAVTVPLRDQLR